MRLSALASAKGFSLAETAFAIAILAVVIGALVPGILSLRGAEQSRATTTRLEAVMRSAAGFVQANGCVPCPAPYASQGTAGRGVVRGDTGASPLPCASCATAVGLVPFRSLGLPESFARDGYGRWMTYAVDAALTAFTATSNPPVSIPPAAPCKSGDLPATGCGTDDITNSTRKKGICAPGIDNTHRLTVFLPGGGIQQAAILVLSHGPNGRGAFTEAGSIVTHAVFPTAQPACVAGSTGPERCNADEDITFVAGTLVSGTDPFDDQMIYLDRNALIASLGGPGCQISW